MLEVIDIFAQNTEKFRIHQKTLEIIDENKQEVNGIYGMAQFQLAFECRIRSDLPVSLYGRTFCTRYIALHKF